jgi:Mg/Co/Ni transporter MgtE
VSDARLNADEIRQVWSILSPGERVEAFHMVRANAEDFPLGLSATEQAAMFRAMKNGELGEVTIKDWWRIIRRELTAGLALGLILATIGTLRILAWQGLFDTYGAHYRQVAATVGISLVGVVIWGTLAGSMLPVVIRRLGFDPASASAPFVATLVDVSGLVIYFKVAQIVLQGSLL